MRCALRSAYDGGAGERLTVPWSWRQAPLFGGQTGFADTMATFQGLSPDERQMLRGRTCIHDFDGFRYQQGRQGVSDETVEELRSSYPVARHPMVRT